MRDHEFRSAAFEAQSHKLPIDCAPKLPIPKKERWNSLVYMHGRLPQASDDGDNLVLSSSDFRQAYLTERWASRFATGTLPPIPPMLFLGTVPTIGHAVHARRIRR